MITGGIKLNQYLGNGESKVSMTKTVEILSEHQSNLDWFNAHYSELKKRYSDKWIAVRGSGVVDSDRSHSKLVVRLKRKHGSEYSKLAVIYISKRPIELIL